MRRMDVNHVIVSLVQGIPQSPKETPCGAVAIKERNLWWRRDFRFEIGTNGDVATVAQWQAVLVILTIGRPDCQYEM